MESQPVYNRAGSLATPGPNDCYLRVGDTVILTKTQIVSKQGGGVAASLTSAKSRTLAVKAEGLMDRHLYGELFSTWVTDTEMCLFRVENPLGMLRGRSNRRESSLAQSLGRVTSLEEAAEKEARVQQEANMKGLGQVIKYGQSILLRHVNSEGLLSLNSMGTGAEPGTWEVLVSRDSPQNYFTKITLSPNNQLQKPGESIKYGDKLNIEFTIENQQYLLHVSKSRKEGGFEINASHLRSDWEFRKYESHLLNREAIRCGVPVMLGLGRRGMLVTEGFDKPESVKTTKKLKGSGLSSSPESKSAKLNLLSEPQSAVSAGASPHSRLISSSYSNLSQSILSGMKNITSISLVKKLQLTTQVNDCGVVWILEKATPLQGGTLAWEDRFYLKNVKSGHYVANASLELKPEPNPDFAFLVVRPESFQFSTYVPISYPIIIKSTDGLFLSPVKIVSEEEFMMDIVPTRHSSESTSVTYESKLYLAKDQDTENPLEIVTMSETDYFFFIRITKLIPKIKEVRSIISNWMSVKDTLPHLNYVEKEDEIKIVGYNFCESLNILERMLEESNSPEIHAKQRCNIVGLGFATQLIEIATLLVDFSNLSKRPEEVEDFSFPTVATLMEEKIWTFMRILVDNLPFVCEILATQDRVMMNLLHLRKELVGPVLTEVYRVLDPEIKDVRAFFAGWIKRLGTITAQNVIDQTVFFQLIRNVCEVDDSPKPEYQRALISLLYEEKQFFLLKLYKENDDFLVHFCTLGESDQEFLAENPELVNYARSAPDGRLVFKLQELSLLPNYICYTQQALGLITVLCKGKVSQGREVAFHHQGLALDAKDVFAILKMQSVHFSVIQSLVDLIQATVLTTPPLVSFRELEAENYSFEEEQVASLEQMNNFQGSFNSAGLSDKILNMIQASLHFWLSPALPAHLHRYTQMELLRPVLSTLRFTYALIEFNHTSSLFTRAISVVLAYILAGFSGERGSKFVGKHWVVDVVQQLMKERVSGEVDIEVMEFFKQVIETVDLIQLKTKRYKLCSVIAFFKDNQDKTLEANSPELLEFIATLKSYTTSDIPNIEGIRQSLNLSNETFASFGHMLKYSPNLADYLVYAVLNLYSVPPDLKESVIRTLENSFNEELLFLNDVRRSELLQGEVVAKRRLLDLKAELEPSDIITKARTELNEERPLVSLHFLRKVLFELVALLRPSPTLSITQNILRNLGFHKTIIQLWPLINRLDQEKDMAEENDLLAFDFKALLVSFLACFARHNPINQEALLDIIEKKNFTLDFPEYAELIFDLTHFSHMPQSNLQKVISNIVDRCAEYTVQTDLNAHHFLRLMMLSSDRKELSSMQNIIARYIAEKYRSLPEFDISEERCYKDVVFLELLSRAAIQNPAITIMCRELISFGRLEALFEKHNNPAVLCSLLSFLVYVYLWPTEDKCIKQLNSSSVLSKVIDKLLATLKHIFTDSAHLTAIGKMNNYELVFEDGQWPMVDVNIAREPFDEDRNMWRLLCFQYVDDQRQGGFLPLVPWLFRYADSPEKLRTQATSAFENVQALESSLQACREEGINVANLEKAISSFNIEMLRCFSDLAEPKSETLVTPRTFRGLKRLHSFGVSTILANSRFPAFLELFAKAYTSGSSVRPFTFTKKIARRFLRFTGLRKLKGVVKKEDIETNVINLGRLHRLFTQTSHSQEYFSILTHIIPDDHEFKVRLNSSYIKSGVIDEAVNELLQPSMSSVNAALMFLNKLLDEQDLAFQHYFQTLIDRSERSYYLFSRIKEELHCAKSVLLSKVGLTPTSEQATLSDRDVFLVRSLKFLQLCCDNCNIDFQNYIRQQGNQIGKADVDLVSEVARFLIDIYEKAKELSRLTGPGKIINKAIAALLDFVTGPCPENQQILGNNVLLFQAINRFVKVTQLELDEISTGIHNKLMIFCLTLLEGTPDPSVPLTMVKFLDLKVLREGVERIHSELIKGQEEDMYRELRSKPHMAKIRTAILQAILLLKLKKYSNHLELKKFMAEGSAAYEFYTSNIGYVQVDYEGSIEELYFPVPFMCKFLTPASRQSLIFDINRSSHQSKIEEFLDKVDYYHTEMEHQQHLSQHRWLKSLSKLWKLYAQLSYIMVLLLNLLLLCTLTETEEKTVEAYPWLWLGLLFLGLMQLLLYVASFVFNMVEYFPLRLRNTGSYESLEIDKYPGFPDNESYLLTDTFKSIELANRDTTSFKSSLRNITQNLDFYYNFIYLLVAVLGLYEPLIYPILLLDIIKQNQELVNILKSITVNLRQLLLTLVLGLIIIFLFSVHSFGYFQKYYNKESNADCSTLYNCFTSTLYFGIRAGGGIGDGLDPATSEDYWARMAFDLLYYVIMIIILLNIIFGIIIDTFAQLRDERSQMAHDLSNTCFVCGSSRSEIELKGKGWSYHFMCEHSPFSYLSFFVFLQETNIVDCSGVEKYVKEKMKTKDSTFMPTTSKLLQMKAAS